MEFTKLYPTWLLTRRYVLTGLEVGAAQSYFFMGPPVGWNRLASNLKRFEKEYARRGYRTVPHDVFITVGGFGGDIKSHVGIRRNPDEEAILYFDELD
jgi:hypothetical protein